MRKNAVFMVLYDVLILLIPLITAPIVSRTLGASGVGIYSYTYSIASYFIIIAQLGVKMYGRREIAKVSHDSKLRSQVFWSIYMVQFLATLIAVVSYVSVVNVAFKNHYYSAMMIQTIIIIAAGLDISWFYFGIEKFTVTVARNTAVKFLMLISIILFIRDANDVLVYVVLMALCDLLSEIIIWVDLRKQVQFISLKDIQPKRYVKPLLIFTLPVLSSQLFSVTDKVMLGAMLDVEQVGFYENAYKIARVPITVITTLGTVLMPRITNMVAQGKINESKKYIEKSLSLTMILCCAFSFGISSVSATFIPLYLGSEFEPTIRLLQVMAFLLIFVGWGNVFRSQYILPNNMDNFYVRAMIYAAVINIVLNAVTIPIIGTMGAVVASVCSEAIICVYQSFKIRKDFQFGKLISFNAKYLMSGLVMYIVVQLIYNTLGSGLLSLIVQILIGALVYCVCIAILEVITKQYIALDEARNLMQKIRGRIKHE